jgi:nitrogen fixation-related uncharacterized protein
MSLVYLVLVFGLIAAFSASVVWGLWWALKGGQFSDFQKGALSIFDEDEPVGHTTDRFPDADPERGVDDPEA